MSTTLPNMGLVQPTLGGSSGEWDGELNDDLALLDAHDHSPGKGPRIPTSGIGINADLTFGGLYAPINLHRLTFASIVALSSSNKSLFVSTSDNELYWRSNAGVNVKLTNGAALNVAAFTGGIGGDYAAVGAAVAYDDSLDRYTFKQESPGNWARLACGDVRLFQTGTTESVFVGLAVPTALASSYTITMPLTAPASTSPVQMTSAGVLTSGASDAMTVGGLLTASAGVTATTVQASGLVTASAGVTCAANQHVTVSGTGAFRHGDRVLTVGAASFTPGNNFSSASINYSASSNEWVMGTAPNDILGAGVPLAAGDRIVSLTWHFSKGGSASGMIFTLLTRNGTTVTTRDTVSDGTSGAGFISTTRAAINYTIVSGDAVWLQVQSSNAAHRFAHCIVTFDRP